MKQWINGLFSGKGTPFFEEAKQPEKTEELQNPCRGFYSLYHFAANGVPEFSECGEEGLQSPLVMVFIDIGAYKNEPLTDAALGHIREIFSHFTEMGQDMVVRVSYDREGRAAGKEPSLCSEVLGHVKQLLPLLSEYADSIFTYQGVLVGNWGEMHGSRYLAGDYMEEAIRLLRQGTGAETYLAVRTPSQWRSVQRKSETDAALREDRLGLFDDAILGSETDLGTFGTEPRCEAGWGTPWQTEDELGFVEKLCLRVPNGGEAVYGDGFAGRLSQEQVLARLGRQHITYLNQMHDLQLLSYWKEAPYGGKGAFAGKSLYEYISAHLGYRFLVAGVVASFLPKRSSWQETRLEVIIKNTGFAPVYQTTELELLLYGEGADTPVQIKKLQEELPAPGEKKAYRFSFFQGKGRVFLRLSRKRDGRVIYFAHPAEASGEVYLGTIQ